MSICPILGLLYEFLDDSLPGESREVVQKHLGNCEICSATLDSMCNTLVLTADDRVFALPACCGERLRAGANSRPQKPTQDGD